MKRITGILLALAVALALASCGQSASTEDASPSSVSETQTVAAAQSGTEAASDDTQTRSEAAAAQSEASRSTEPETEAESASETTEAQTEPISSVLRARAGYIIPVVLAAAIIVAAAVILDKRKKARQKNSRIPENVQPLAQTTIEPEDLEGYTEEEDLFMTPIGEEPREIAIPNVTSVHHIGNRKNQEDSFGISDVRNEALCKTKGVLAVVADGMGGLQSGEDVSSIAVLRMQQSFADLTIIENDSDELDRLLQDAVQSVNAHLTQTVGLRKGGSTLIAVILHGNALSWISVGDSRTALFRDGKLRDLHGRHNFAADLERMVQQNRITAEQALNHPDRNKLTSFVGMGELKHVDRSAKPIQLLPGDKIILMSDGVFNTLRDPEIEHILSLPFEQIASCLEDAVLCKENPYQDNFTAVILEVPVNETAHSAQDAE